MTENAAHVCYTERIDKLLLKNWSILVLIHVHSVRITGTSYITDTLLKNINYILQYEVNQMLDSHGEDIESDIRGTLYILLGDHILKIKRS